MADRATSRYRPEAFVLKERLTTYVRKAALTGLLLLGVSSCAGAGSATPIVLQPAPGGGTTSTTASTITLPNAGGFGGTMTFPATVATTSIAVTSSTTTASTARLKQSGTLSRFFSVTMSPTRTMTLPALPSFNLTFPSTYAAAGKQFYYALQVPAPAGVDRQFRTEGPGLVSGHQVFFGASLQPYTIVAGQKYIFEFYADTDGAIVSDLLYVLNGTDTNSDIITAYPVTASGNAAPVRTISGSNTHLALSQDLAADADGDLVVANAVDTLESTIEIFTEGANGNARPVQLFTIPVQVSKMSIDSTNGNIDVVSYAYGQNGSITYTIGIYSPTGTLLRTIVPTNFSGGFYAITGLTIDARGELIVAGYTNPYLYDPFICAIDVFAANAGPSTPPAYVNTLPAGLGCDAVTYARSVDHIFVLSGNTIFESKNDAAGTIVRQITNPQFPTTNTIGVNTAGSAIFVASQISDAIVPLTPNASTFTVGPYLAGPATFLSPRAIVIAPP